MEVPGIIFPSSHTPARACRGLAEENANPNGYPMLKSTSFIGAVAFEVTVIVNDIGWPETVSVFPTIDTVSGLELNARMESADEATKTALEPVTLYSSWAFKIACPPSAPANTARTGTFTTPPGFIDPMEMRWLGTSVGMFGDMRVPGG